MEKYEQRNNPHGIGEAFMQQIASTKGCLVYVCFPESQQRWCVMPAVGFQDLPFNIYVVVFGTGIFAFILSLIFCCYLISNGGVVTCHQFRLRRQAQSELYGYKEVVLKGKAKKLSLQEQTCAVCLEDFREKDELAVCPCKHAFHRKCLVKWLEIRNACPMCNKPVAQHVEQTPVSLAQAEELI